MLVANAAQFQNVTCVHSLVAEGAGERSGRLSEHHGTARFVSEETDGSCPTRPLADILEAHPEFLSAKLLKIDTDGFDNAILRGAMNWLREAKPIVFFEFDPASLTAQGERGSEIFGQLRAAGYVAGLFYHNSGEFMFGTDLQDESFFVDWYEFLVRRRAAMYCDVCVFSEEDIDLHATAHAAERAFFNAGAGVAKAGQ